MMRIDKLLWFLRFAKTRGVAQTMAESGYLRVNGRRIDRAHQRVAPGDVLVIPLVKGVQVVRLAVIPLRRGPPSEAQACYRVLDAAQDFPIAPANRDHAAEGDLQP